jgi:biotin carboxylase
MRRVLILVTTASYRAGAFLDAARSLGVEAVVGTDQPQSLAGLNPAGHLVLDYASTGRAVEAIRAFAQRHPLDAVVAADDEGVAIAAAAARALGCPHHSPPAARAARDKRATRETLARAGIPSPRFRCLATGADPRGAARRAAYPCVLKPLFLSASRGVIRADDAAGFLAAFHRIEALLARPEVAAAGGPLAREILVEDYVPGVEVALEGLVSRGRLRPLAIFDKPDPLVGPYFEESIYVTPSRLPAAAREEIVSTTARAAAALGLAEGPVHAELRWNERGAWPLEIAPRSIGGLCSRALRFGDGVSLESLILRHALGMATESLAREPLASGVMMIPIPRGGELRAVRGIDAARGVARVEEIRITVPVGQALVPPPEGDRYLGFIFARGQEPAEVEAALRAAHGLLEFEIAPAGAGASAMAHAATGSREWAAA